MFLLVKEVKISKQFTSKKNKNKNGHSIFIKKVDECQVDRLSINSFAIVDSIYLFEINLITIILFIILNII